MGRPRQQQQEIERPPIEIRHLPREVQDELLKAMHPPPRSQPERWLALAMLALGTVVSGVNLVTGFYRIPSLFPALLSFALMAGAFSFIAAWIVRTGRTERQRLRDLLLQRNLRPAVCFECGYDLSQSPGPLCPECGTRIANDPAPSDVQPEP